MVKGWVPVWVSEDCFFRDTKRKSEGVRGCRIEYMKWSLGSCNESQSLQQHRCQWAWFGATPAFHRDAERDWPLFPAAGAWGEQRTCRANLLPALSWVLRAGVRPPNTLKRFSSEQLIIFPLFCECELPGFRGRNSVSAAGWMLSCVGCCAVSVLLWCKYQ